MEEKFYFEKKIEVRLNEREKNMFDEIAYSLKSELGTESDNDSEVARLAIEIAAKNKHLIDVSIVDAYFDEVPSDNITTFDVDCFIKDINDDGTLRTDLMLYFKFGYMDLHRGIKIEVLDDKILKFHITSSNQLEIDKETIRSVSIYNNDECYEEVYNNVNEIVDREKYCYLIKFY